MVLSGKNILTLFSLARREYGRYKWSILLVAILGFIGSIMEGVGINSIIPIFSFVNKNSDQGADIISQTMVKFFNFFHLAYTLKTILLLIVALFVIKALIIYCTTLIAAKINASYEINTRSDLFKLIISANWPYLSKQKIGHLEQVLITDVNNSSNLLSYLNASILIIANLIIYILISLNISVFITILTLLVSAIIFLIFKPFFYRNRVLSEQVGKIYKDLSHYVNENMLGIKTIKAMSMGGSIMKQADRYFEKTKNLNLQVIALRNLTSTMLQPVGMIFIVAIFAFFYKTGSFNFASFAVIVYSINKVFNFIQSAQAQLHSINSQIPFAQNIARYREEVRAAKEEDDGLKNFVFNKSLEFADVNFSYNHDDRVLSHLNFFIKKGETVGLIGPSGAGKTTVVDLILRLFQPVNGQILLDGRSVNEISLRDWRKHIGYVSQDMFLINDSIENNIKFYDENISRKDIISAAKMANIYDFIERQPQKFSTVIGERGVMLSGGERQRIVLARILARKPEILVLDEATSALDNESEVLIQKSIEGLKGNVTIIIIAHRLSTVMSADKLFILEKGRMAEQGSPYDLLKDKDSYFFKVYNIKS